MPRTPHIEGNLFSRKVLNLFVLSSSRSLPCSHYFVGEDPLRDETKMAVRKTKTAPAMYISFEL